jgi:hypothetical protein
VAVVYFGGQNSVRKYLAGVKIGMSKFESLMADVIKKTNIVRALEDNKRRTQIMLNLAIDEQDESVRKFMACKNSENEK